MKLIKALRRNKKLHIVYHDSGAWTIYRDKKSYLQWVKMFQAQEDTSDIEQLNKSLEAITIARGDDYMQQLPELVEAMAEILGFTTASE